MSAAPEVPAPPRLRRDALTWLLYAQLSLYGFFLYSFGPSVNLLRAEQHVSRGVSGLHGTAMAAGAVAAGLTSHHLVARFGRRAVLWGSIAALAAGILLFISSPALPVTLLGAMVASWFGSVMVNTVAAALTDHHGPAGSAAFTEANGLAGVASVAAPTIVGVAVAVGIGWRAAALVPVIAAATLALVATRFTVPVPEPRPVPPADDGHPSRLSARFWWAWGTLVATTALEFSITLWATDLLQLRTGLGASGAAAGLTAFLLGMTAGRLLGSRLALRHSPDTLLAIALVVFLAGFGLFWASTRAPLALAGLLLAGVGGALHYPVGLSRCILASAGRPELAVSRAALGTGVAVGLAPFSLGVLADHVGTHLAYLIVPALVVAGLATIAASRRLTSPAASAPVPPAAPA